MVEFDAIFGKQEGAFCVGAVVCYVTVATGTLTPLKEARNRLQAIDDLPRAAIAILHPKYEHTNVQVEERQLHVLSPTASRINRQSAQIRHRHLSPHT